MIESSLERLVARAQPPLRLATAGALLALLALPSVAAHGARFGAPVETRFQLPPWVVWSTGASVVLLSFVVVAGFLTRRTEGPARGGGALSARDEPTPWSPGRAAALVLLVTVVAAGLGPGDAGLPEVVFWLVLWSLMPILAYTFGRGAWESINPFRPLGAFADRLRRGHDPAPYPAAAGAWPVVGLFLLLMLLEVAVPQAHTAAGIAGILLAYLIFSFAGMLLFGARTWIAHAEVFTRAFEWWGAFAPRQRTGDRAEWGAPARALATSSAAGSAGVAFVVVLLYGVNFDGILATRGGQAVLAWLGTAAGPAAPVLLLVAGFGAFLGIYHGCVALIRRAAESLEPHRVIAARFAPSLIPIAVGYHAAHNVFIVLENMWRIVAVVADPFGLGWTLVPAPGPTALPAAGAWYGLVQLTLIITGHVVAVVAAHRLAFGGFPSRVQAVRAEVPLTLAMVAYTLIGLWIVSAAAAGSVV